MGVQPDEGFLPGFLEQEQVQEAKDAVVARQKAVAEHVHLLRDVCWPEWAGPSVGGLISVHAPIVWSLTHGENRYHYMAPAWIDTISEDRMTYEVVVRYPADSICSHYNGERLRLDITELWAPVGLLRPHFRPVMGSKR